MDCTDTTDRTDHAEEGAAAIMAALGAALVLLVAVLAIDLGSHVLAQRDLQGAVDLAALDAVTGLVTDADPATEADARARESLRRNSGWSARDGRTVTVTVGRFDPLTRTFTPTTSAPDAVLVEAVTDLGRLTGVLPGADEVRRRAIAATTAQASLSIGTSLASVDSDEVAVRNRLLARLLGSSTDLTLDAVGHQGLASGTVSLRRLALDLGLASPAELLDTTVSVGTLLTVAAQGLSASGDPLDVAAATPLSTIATQAAPSTGVRLGDALRLEVGTVGAVADVEVRASDLVMVVAQVVNGDNVVDLGLPVSVPGVGSGSLRLAVLEPAQLAAGRPGTDPATGTWRTVATTAQVRLLVDLSLDPVATPTVSTAPLTLPFTIEAARGEAALATVTCATGGVPPLAGVPTATSAVTTTLGAPPADLVTTAAPVPLTPVVVTDVAVTTPLGGPLDLGALTASLQQTVGATQEDLAFDGAYPEARRTAGSSSLGGTPRVPGSDGDGRVGLAVALDTADLDIAAASTGLDVEADVLGPVLDATTPVLDAVDRRVVAPVLEALGTTLGTADVTVASVDCGGRALVE